MKVSLIERYRQRYIRPRLNRALFAEGLRQLKAPGIVFAGLELLMFLFATFNTGFRTNAQLHYTGSGNIFSTLDDLLLINGFLSAVFLTGTLLTLSHFLRAGKGRDFYGAAPHSLGTVWMNFALSALAWTEGSIALGYLASMVIALCHDLKYFGLYMQALAGSLAWPVLIFGIVTLAVTLTGRLVNVLTVCVGLAVTPSFLWTAFYQTVAQYYDYFDFIWLDSLKGFPDPFATILTHLDVPLLDNFTTWSPYDSAFSLLCSGSAVLYCLLMGAFWAGIAYLFGAIRTGDTAGRPFVNAAAHWLGRLSVALPLSLLVASYVPNCLRLRIFPNSSWRGEMIFTGIVILAAYAAAYWLLELLLTFDVKHAHRAFRWLPVPALLAVLVTGAGYLSSTRDFLTTVKPEDVASFSLVRNNTLDDDLAIFRLSDTYGRLITEESAFTDKDTITYVTGQINSFIKAYQESPRKAFQIVQGRYDYEAVDENGNIITYEDGAQYDAINFKLTLKNGKVLYRSVAFDAEHRKRLAEAIQNDRQFMKRFLTLPDAEKLNIWIYEPNGLNADDVKAIYTCFTEEYNALSDEQKLEFLKKNLYSDYDGDYRYTDPTDNTPAPAAEEAPETAAAETETADTTTQKQPSTAIRFKTVKENAFSITVSNYDASVTMTAPSYELSISGFAFGHLYQPDYHYSQSFIIDSDSMPKTHALVVRTAQSYVPEAVKRLREKNGPDKNRYLHADYFGTEGYWSIGYMENADSEELRMYFSADTYGEDGNPAPFQGKIVTVDTNAMISKLLADAEATGNKVDFSKPYAVVHTDVSGYGAKDYFNNVFYVQTDFSYEDFAVPAKDNKK